MIADAEGMVRLGSNASTEIDLRVSQPGFDSYERDAGTKKHVVEIESICLFDQIIGECERIISEALTTEKELAELYGLPELTTV